MNYSLDRLNRQREELENLIRAYQSVSPVNNYINTNQTSNLDLIEMRILNENEEVDNLYVQNKTLFISDNMMILKGVDGKLEKWEVKKIYPIDKKDAKISELELEVKKLKEMIENEHNEFNEPVREFKQSNDDADEYANARPKANGRFIQR